MPVPARRQVLIAGLATGALLAKSSHEDTAVSRAGASAIGRRGEVGLFVDERAGAASVRSALLLLDHNGKVPLVRLPRGAAH